MVTEAPRLGDAAPRIAERTDAGPFGTLRTAFAVQADVQVRFQLRSGTPVERAEAHLPLNGWVSVPTLLTALPSDRVRSPRFEAMTPEEVENRTRTAEGLSFRLSRSTRSRLPTPTSPPSGCCTRL